MKRTPTIEHDGSEDFEVLGTVTKHWTDKESGRRFLRGVCTGVGEDADGERVSQRAIARMAAKSVGAGQVLATASHDQEWWNEFGDVVALKHDRENDELQLDVALPPKGEDPIADKAYKRAQKGDLGWSIGGKLQKSYFELVPSAVGKGGTPRRRHVLDDIDLRHVMLTKRPAYRDSFATTVAKTAKLADAPTFADADLYEEDDDLEKTDAADILKRAAADLEATVTKAKTPPPAAGEDPEEGAEADEGAADVNPDEDPDAGTPGAGDSAPEQRTDAQAAADLPEAKGARHLACPKCGTEFAAPLPDDLQPGEMAEKPDTDDTPSAADTAKTTNKETTMATAPLNDTLAQLRALASGGEVKKTEEETPTVAKAEEAEVVEATPTEKLVAAGVRLSVEKTEELGEALTDVAKTLVEKVDAMQTQLNALGTGRQSIAKRRGGEGDPPPERAIGEEETPTVAKVGPDDDVTKLGRDQLLTLSHDEIGKRMGECSPADLMKVINYRDRGIQ